MAPVEIDTIPRDVITPISYLKSVDKAFELPLVTDTYNEVSKFAQPISPYVETVKNIATPYVEKFSPMVESGFISIKTTAEENIIPQLPEGTTDNIKSKLDSAKEQVASAVENLDTMVCHGLDQLTTRLPALKEPTTELVETTKGTAVSYFEFAQDYVASFGISQIALKLSDKGLQVATDGLKATGLGKAKPIKPVVDGIEILRRYGRAVRRAGAKMAGIQPAKTIGEASVVGAVAEVLGLNFFLSVVGLQLVPANILQKSTTGELDTTTEEETVDKLSDEKIAGYLSDEDPDYVPNGVTEESAEEDSDVDVGEEKEGDDIEEIKEVVDEVAETTEIRREEAVSKIGAVVEKTVVETEDITEAGHIVGKIVDETDDKIEDVVEEVVEEAKTVDEDVENLLENIKKLTVEETEVVVKEVESKIEEVVEKTVEETVDTTEETEDIVEKIVEDKIEDVVEEVVREAEEKFVEGSWLSQIVKKVEDAVESVTETIEDTVDAVEIEDVEDISNVEEADLAEELD